MKLPWHSLRIDILSTIAAQMAVNIIFIFGLFFGIATGQGLLLVASSNKSYKLG